jgi:hypothetical protein
MTFPDQRIAIVGSRFGKLPGGPVLPEWREKATDAAREWTRALVASLPQTTLLVVSSEPCGVPLWTLAANRGLRPELQYRPGALGCPGRTDPELCTWPLDLATAVYVVWDGRSRTAYRMAMRARELGRLVSFVAFSEAAPAGASFGVSS